MEVNTLPLLVTYDQHTTPPIGFLYAIAGGYMNLPCQYTKYTNFES